MEQQLPKNWVETKLDNVVTYKKGKKPKVLQEIEFENSIPYLDIKAFEKNIISRYADVDSSNIIEKKDIGIVWDGARSGWVSYGQYGAVGSTIAILKPLKISSTFLLKFLQSKFEFINSNTRGTGIPHVDPKILWDIDIPIVPLPEQERIVAKLDVLFASLDKLNASLDKIPSLLKNFKQAVLESVFDQNFELKTFQELCDKIQDGAHHSPKKQYSHKEEGKFLYITSKNIRNNYLKLSNVVYVDEDFHNTIYPRCKPELGDVLLTKDGANTGNVTLNIIDEPFSLLSSVCLIKTKKQELNASYLKYYIQSPIGFKRLSGQMSGTAIKRLTLTKIKKAVIPITNLEEQTEIVKRVESLFGRAEVLEAHYHALKEKVDQLPQAILAKAFKGELVPQLPTDGNAEDLLKEILALKEELKAKPKKK